MPIVFPLLRGFIHRRLKLTPTSQRDSKKTVDQVFDEVAKRLGDGRNFLVGDMFTAADLTFAALSAAVLIPENYGVKLRSEEHTSALQSLMRISYAVFCL